MNPPPDPQIDQNPIEIKYGDIVKNTDGFAEVTGLIQNGKFKINIKGNMESVRDFMEGEYAGKLLSIDFHQVEKKPAEIDQKEAEIRSQLYARLDAIRSRIDQIHLPVLLTPHLVSHIDLSIGNESRFEVGRLDPARDRVIEIVPTAELQKGCIYQLSYLVDPRVGFQLYDHWQCGQGARDVSTGFRVRSGNPTFWENYSWDDRIELVVYGQESPVNGYDINPSWTLTANDVTW